MAFGSLAKRVSTPAPPFGSFVEEDGGTLVAVGKWLCGQLRLLQLKLLLNATLERVLQRDHGLVGEVSPSVGGQGHSWYPQHRA